MALQGSVVKGFLSSNLRTQQPNSSRRLQHVGIYQKYQSRIISDRSSIFARCDTKDDQNGMNRNNSSNQATKDVNNAVQADTTAQNPPTDTVAKPVEEQNETKEQNDSSASKSDNLRIDDTLADLNALLGIDEEEEEKQKEIPEPKPQQDTRIKLDTSPQALAEALRQDLEEAKNSGDDTKFNEKLDELQRVINSAKKLAENGDISQLGQQVDDLIDMVQQQQGLGNGIDKLDLNIIKNEIVRNTKMTVSEVRNVDLSDKQLQALIPGGVLLRGAVRGTPSDVLQSVYSEVNKQFPDKYEVLLVDDPVPLDPEEFMAAQDNTNQKVGLQILPKTSEALVSLAREPQNSAYLVALLSAVLTIGTITTVSASFTLAPIIPDYVQQWLQQGNNLKDGYIPPEIAAGIPGIDQVFAACGPPLAIILGQQVLHETGHRVVALLKNVKLGLSYVIPSTLIGTFGSIMPIRSIVANRKDLWDIAAAGPLAGGTFSLMFFIAGLFFSVAGGGKEAGLVPIPTELLSGSLGLGAITQLTLGEEIMRAGSTVMLHPYLIAGWCGLYATSLNLLPAGSLDGGRLTQAAFGKSTLALTQFFTYICLALGFVGGATSFTFGLYTILLQREVEKQIRDGVSGVGKRRQIITGVLLVLAVLILIPNAPNSDYMINTKF